MSSCDHWLSFVLVWSPNLDPFDIIPLIDLCTQSSRKKVMRQFHNFYFNKQISSLNKLWFKPSYLSVFSFDKIKCPSLWTIFCFNRQLFSVNNLWLILCIIFMSFLWNSKYSLLPLLPVLSCLNSRDLNWAVQGCDLSLLGSFEHFLPYMIEATFWPTFQKSKCTRQNHCTASLL